MAKQQGTQASKPLSLEFGVDTVYERANIVRVTDPDKGDYWEYDEAQYTYPEYAKRQQQQIDDLMLAQIELAAIIEGGGGNG